MTPDQAKRVARRRKAALRERARRIRVTVASLSATLFVTAFLVVYVQLASGHDPALSADSKRIGTTSQRSHVSTSPETSEAASTEREQSASAEEEATTESGESTTGSAEESTASGEEEAATSSEEATPLTTSQS
jgi:hypothetical protein